MMDSFPDFRLFSDKNRLAKAACDYVLDIEHSRVQKNSVYRIVMAGGSTPQQVYALLAQQSCDWKQWQLFLGDERVLPENDAERNSQMIKKSLLDHVSIPSDQVHFMRTELGLDKAAQQYVDLLNNTKLPFDLVLLGMGEDGHTASLFPGLDYSDNKSVQKVTQSPKPPAERLTMSASSLSNNTNLLFLVTGYGKHQALQDWKNGTDVPISRITSNGKAMLFVDEQAWFGH